MDPNDEINSDVNLKSKRNPDFYRAILSTNQSSFLEIQKNKNSFENQLKEGKQLFFANCNVCHIGGKNLIIPEKNLKKETLEINGMNTVNAIVYQIINGKNGMPAFGGRLTELEIQEIATYVLEEANISFK
jgi:cytochrome c6